MRYIILPLAGLLFLWWLYVLIKNRKDPLYLNNWSKKGIHFIHGLMTLMIIAAILYFGGIFGIMYIVKNW